MSLETSARKSYGKCAQSAVIPSTEVTARQRNHALVRALVAHHAYALHGKEHCARLPNVFIKVPFTETADEDRVYFLQDSNFLPL